MIVGGGLEEAGWSIITFPKLNKEFNFVISGIITTAILWIWHLPLFFIPGVHQYQKNYFIFGLFVLGSSFMPACIREVTGSVWLCMLCHSIVNALPEVFRYDPCFFDYSQDLQNEECIQINLLQSGRNSTTFSSESLISVFSVNDISSFSLNEKNRPD